MIAYLDRNVLSQLRQRTRGVSAEDEIALRKAVKRGNLVLPLSIVTLSETLLMEDKKRAFDEARWIVGLTGRGHVLNDTVPLLIHCLRAYARGVEPPTPYVTTLDLTRVESPTPRDRGALLKTMLDYKRQRTAWTERWTGALEAWGDEQHSKLNDFLNAHTGEWQRHMAERAGVHTECERRGWEGLLALKTIRLGVIAPLILAHAKIFRDRELEEAHFGDLHHVVTATCADVFVTHDRRLRELIHRAQVPDLEVLTLPQLVRRLNSVGTAEVQA